MWAISRFFLIIFCALNTAFIATAAEADAEELSNDIAVDQEPVVVEQLDLTLKETKSELTTPEPEETDVAITKNKTDNLSLEKSFDNAVEAYLNNDWESCIDGFEKEIESYKEHKKVVVGCRRECREESNAAKPMFAEDIENYHFYERKLRETLCLMKCKIRTQNGGVKAKLLHYDVEVKYLERRPYEYLHICYYQMKRHQDAANAIFTFLAVHPKHEQSLKNLRFYVDLPDVVEDEIVDLEAELFIAMYRAGIEAHNNENYLEVIEQIENSLKAYMKAENDCRLYCEGPFDQGWLPEFTMSIANHFTYGLKCKRSCSYRLNNLNGDQRNDLVMDHYHYLQFAYFQIGKLKEACAAIESYLLFVPNDETMLRNRNYFMGLPEIKKQYFQPREEALFYVERQEYELRILFYIQEEYYSVANTL